METLTAAKSQCRGHHLRRCSRIVGPVRGLAGLSELDAPDDHLGVAFVPCMPRTYFNAGRSVDSQKYRA